MYIYSEGIVLPPGGIRMNRDAGIGLKPFVLRCTAVSKDDFFDGLNSPTGTYQVFDFFSRW